MSMKTIETNNPEEVGTKIHAFERAGLGKAPFRFVRFEVRKYQACPGAPIQPGTCCDYCMTGIMGVYWIRSVDGREFKVGCDCVAKTGDAGLLKKVSAAKAKHNRELAAARDERKTADIEAALADEGTRAKLVAKPHPHPYMASKGETLLGWVEFMMRCAGASGRARVAKVIKNLG